MRFATDYKSPEISLELFNLIKAVVPYGSTILELGSGAGSTVALKRHYTVYSVEHKQDYIGKFNDSSFYIKADLDHPDGFYNLSNIILPKHDALLIDGPDTNERTINMLNYISLFNRNIPWFFDDYTDGEPRIKNGIDSICSFLNVDPIIFNLEPKGFVMIKANNV